MTLTFFCVHCFLIVTITPRFCCNYANRVFSPLVIVGVASPILVAMVTVVYIMKE